MSIEANKKMIQDFFEALSVADVDRIVDAYAEDGTCWTSGNFPLSGTVGKAQIRENAKGVLSVFPDKLKFTIHQMIAEDDRIVVEAESYGQHASGQVYNNQYLFLFRLRDGKIVEMKEYMDTMHANDVLCAGMSAE